MSTKQALLVYLPKTSTLRDSTRVSRATSGRYREPEDLDKRRRKNVIKDLAPKESNRPFVGLTQVCTQLRKEFYPLYIKRQEVGLDLAYTSMYVKTFFNPDVSMCFADTDPAGKNMPFRGNITIAVADKILPVEKTVGYIDILPLLDTWANSMHIEAGFGRYSRKAYIPQRDGEAKDL